MIKKSFILLKNKYLLTTVIIISWILFFDKNNLLQQYGIRQQLNDLEKERDYYATEIVKNKAELNALMSDSTLLEKFARENYYFKKDNEDLYVIVPADSIAKVDFDK
ncbi:MAG: septum formation initiator family protein [Bacteroidetes bacterium]|nr:septum formation initiator family protein [Bacteroidota bacterium]